MMAHKDGRVGTFVLDIRLGKLGRFKKASGTDDASLFAELVAMFRMLRRRRQWDVLALVLNGHLSPLDLYDLFAAGRLDAVPTAEHVLNLRTTIARWLANLDRKPSTVRQYTYLLGGFGDARNILSHVPRLLADERQSALAGKRSVFNARLSAVRQMLVWAGGERHPLVAELDRLQPLRLTRRPGNPQEPDAVRDLAQAMGEFGPMVWALALTGMRRNEYFKRAYEVKADRILIHGTKSKAAERAVFLSYPITAPQCGYFPFRDRLSRLTDHRVRTHDLRYTFQRWCEDAGIPVRRVRWYMGHAVKDVSELYGRGKLFAEHVRKDADRLRDYLGEPPTVGLKVAR